MTPESRHEHVPKPPRERPALIATLISAVLAVIKLAGWVATGSSALLAAAVDSATDALVSGMSAWTVRLAGAPPDAGHPFGHGKAEHLSALFQSLVLAAGAMFVLTAPFRGGRLHAEALREPAVGITIGVISIATPVFLSRFLSRAGRHAHSPALEADSAHYASDYLSNGGVVLAFVLDRAFAWHVADTIIAVVIAAAILALAWRVGLSAISGLMDAGLAQSDIALIKDLVARHTDVRGFHELMTRRSGPNRFIQLHVEIDAALSFHEAHGIVEALRFDIERGIPNAIVTIHADPWPLVPEDSEHFPPLEGAPPAS